VAHSPILPLAVVASLALAACSAEEGRPGSPEVAPPHSQQTFVDSATCAECHEAEAKSWTGSHHDLAMQPANEETVLGDFDDASFEALGLTTRFFQRDGGFWVNTEGPDGELHDYPIAYTFGVTPLQQYLVEFPGGRLQCLTVAWDTDDERWFTLYPNDRFRPDDELHWTGRYQNWNMMCAECHSTDLRRGYDAETDSYDTTWHELNVTCQACHGPGAEHVRLARDYGADWEPEPDETGLTVSLRRGDPAPQLETCAPCHSRRRTLIGEAHVAGHSFLDDFEIETLRPPLYHADGQIVEEVYVMGSFLQSKMHQKGVACSDCHDPHSLELWVPGDAVCMQCHSESAPLERFPTLTQKDYATPEHHHHVQESEGARCRSCHMPERTYMQIDERYDHSLRIPRPDMSALIGTPNACNDCHTDQTAEWAAAAVEEWTGSKPEAHLGVVFAAVQTGNEAVASPLASIAHDPETPAIVRATAMDLLSSFPAAAQVKVMALEDSEPLVRAAALEGLDELPPALLLERVRPLLEDPVRLVRIAAARALAGEPGTTLAAQGDEAYNRARAELFASFEANMDSPSAQLNRAVYLLNCGDTEGAVEAYERALFLDRDFLPTVFNLANLFSTIDRAEDARALLEDALTRHPQEGELHYSLGLLRAQLGDLEGAASSLREASKRLPGRPRVQYNFGLAAQQLGRIPEAEAALKRAAALAPEDPDFAYALSTFYLTAGRFDAALEWAEKLVELVPGVPGPAELVEEIKRQRAAAR
jgi:tetratricopeptide (TPR) repeat protein